MCLHIGQGFDAITAPPDAPIDNLIILATQVSALAAQDLLWGGGHAQLPRPQGRVVGGRDRLDPLLPRPLRPALHQPAVARPRLRRQAAERHLPRALARLLRHRPDRRSRCATTSASTSSPGSATTRTPTRSGPTPPRSCSPSSTTPARPTPTSTRSRGRTPAGTSATTRSSTSPRGRDGRQRCGRCRPTSTRRPGRAPSGASATRRCTPVDARGVDVGQSRPDLVARVVALAEVARVLVVGHLGERRAGACRARRPRDPRSRWRSGAGRRTARPRTCRRRRLIRRVAASEPWSTASATTSLTRSSARRARSGAIAQSTASIDTIARASAGGTGGQRERFAALVLLHVAPPQCPRTKKIGTTGSGP